MNCQLSLGRLFLGLLLSAIGVGWRGAGAIAQPAIATPSACVFFAEPQRYNTQTSDDVIVIGAQSTRRYRVVIVGDNAATLTSLRACVLEAFATQSRFGSYIQVGSFERRGEAESLRRSLRRAGYRPRVVYGRL